MTVENFNLLFKSLVLLIAGIIGTGLAVLTLSGKVGIGPRRALSLSIVFPMSVRPQSVLGNLFLFVTHAFLKS